MNEGEGELCLGAAKISPSPATLLVGSSQYQLSCHLCGGSWAQATALVSPVYSSTWKELRHGVRHRHPALTLEDGLTYLSGTAWGPVTSRCTQALHFHGAAIE